MSADAPLVFRDLARRAADPDSESDHLDARLWEPLRPGVEIHRLYGKDGGPSAALLRYAPGGEVPEHLHPGYEHIYVLSGSQQDERGVYAAGDLVVNLPGTRHRVESPGGCVVLVVWERPIEFAAR
jgi:anti-sigma factor ChrR (cupin superfamily)